MSKPKWTPRRVRLGQIQAWEGNPRMSTKAQAQRIIASEKKFGQPVPFLLAPEVDGRFLLYDGHQRLAAWFTVYGADYEMDAMVADRPLTEDEHKELIITLHTGATGSWNWDALSAWQPAELQEWGMNADALKGWNNDANNLKELLRSETPTKDTEAEIDRAEELREKWGVKLGDLWQLGEHHLICGDCTDAAVVARVMGGEKATLMLTDPPYKGKMGDGGFSSDAELRKRTEKLKASIEHIYDFDPTDFLSKCLREFCTEKASFLFWCNKVQLPIYMRFAVDGGFGWYLLLWHKPNFIPLNNKKYYPDTEYLFKISDKGATFNTGIPKNQASYNTYWIEEMGGGSSGHPTEKPLRPHLDQIQICTNSDDAVVDPFSGSGTTIIACENLGRKCRAVEISPAYVSVALERYFQHTGKTPVLIEE